MSELHVVLTLAGFLVPALKLLSNQTCDVSNLDAHVTFLRFVATTGEVSLAIEHLKWIGDNSRWMLPALYDKVIAISSSSSKLDPLLHLFQELQQKSSTSF